MIRHTVAFSLTHPADSPAEADFLDGAADILSAIPGVTDFRVSRQVSPKSSHRFQFAMSFADQDAYARYNDHPDHQAFVASRWAEEVVDFEELDFVAYGSGSDR